MSATRFLTNDNLTRKKWAKELFRVILPAVEFNSFVGQGTDSIVQMRTELDKGQGDLITFGIRLPLVGEGIVGNSEVEGNEEKLRFRDFNSTIEELNHAVDTGGRMEEQRVPYNLVMEGKNGLQEWWSDKLSEYVVNCLCGNSAHKIAGVDFAQAIDEPDSDHHLKVDDVAEASITSAEVMSLAFLDRMKQKAELIDQEVDGAFKVRAISGGKNKYKVLMHNYVFDQLREDTNVGQWGDLLRAAQKLGDPQTELVYNGLLIQKSERVPKVRSISTGGGVYRTVLLGAQAAVWAWGGAGETKSTVMAFVPYKRDAQRFLMIRGGGIWGMKKTRFNSMDYGIITGSSFGKAISA